MRTNRARRSPRSCLPGGIREDAPSVCCPAAGTCAASFARAACANAAQTSRSLTAWAARAELVALLAGGRSSGTWFVPTRPCEVATHAVDAPTSLQSGVVRYSPYGLAVSARQRLGTSPTWRQGTASTAATMSRPAVVETPTAPGSSPRGFGSDTACALRLPIPTHCPATRDLDRRSAP